MLKDYYVKNISPFSVENICNCLINNENYNQAGIEDIYLNEQDTSVTLVQPDMEEEKINATVLRQYQDAGHSDKHWFVMRDLKRSNAKCPAYKLLDKEHIELFTPMREHITLKQGKRVREEVPFIQDLLFVHSTIERLEPILRKTPTLQFRYFRGGKYREPMIVSDTDMEKFIYAVRSSEYPHYYLPGEVTVAMRGHKVRIIGGVLDQYEGYLLAMRGSKMRRLLIELSGFLSVSVEINPEYIQLL